jgi:subtilase family serine protease
MARSFWAWLKRQKHNNTRRQRCCLHLEFLEARDLPSGLHPEYVLLPLGGAGHYSTSGPTGTTPTQIRHAYGFDQISFNNGTIPGDGRGATIAIVDAYDDPNVANDLHQFDVTFGLADPVFTKVNQSGGSTMPAADGGWASEIALDVEWSHAIAPKANILLVEANDSSYTNLFTAVQYAAKQTGVVAVSMSWGGGEFSGENTYDSVFTTPSGHSGVTFIASSGDSGAPVSYPAASPNVLAVGGTTLNLNSAGTILSESGWSGSGGGISAGESQPAYQKGIVTQSTTKRTNPDVAYDADPYTGFPVYDSYNNGTASPWSQFGGTSDAAPQWAGLIAIVDQGRIGAGLNALDGPSQTLPKLYGMPAADFHDITSGTSTGSPHYSAGPGYDLVTGRGTPVANKIVSDLAGQPAATTSIKVSAPTSSTAGSSFTITLTALNSNGTTFTGYAGTVHFTSSDTAAVLPTDYTFTSTDKGVHTLTVALKTAGSQSITATDKANSAIAGSGSVTVNAAAASKLAFGQQPTNVAVGAAINPALTVRVLDAYGNLVSGDNTDKVTISIGSNPGGGVLTGSTTVTVSGGIATFSNLSINKIANGYTLIATSGVLTRVTSATFNVTNSSKVIEGFETIASDWNVSGAGDVNAYQATWAAHDGTYGLDLYAGNDWLYRNYSTVNIKTGDTVSVWVAFDYAADGRAYFGFGAGAGGTLSLVAAPNTGQLILQNNLNYGFTNLAAVSQTYQANHWYRLEVDWGTSGKIVGKLFDSNGTTLLKSVTASTTVITSGGIAFRAIGDDKYFDTVTATYGVNSFVVHAAAASGLGHSGADSLAPSALWQVFSPGTIDIGGGKLEEAHLRFQEGRVSQNLAPASESSSTALERFFAQYARKSSGWEETWAGELGQSFGTGESLE